MQTLTQPIDTLKTAEQFYMFFLGIPEDKWTVDEFEKCGKRCARGHLNFAENGSSYSGEAQRRLVGIIGFAASINDGCDRRYQQPTPKQRILAALRDKFGGTQ